MKVNVQVSDVTLSSVVEEYPVAEEDGDFTTERITIADLVARHVLSTLLGPDGNAAVRDIMKRLRLITDEEIRAQVKPRIDMALVRPMPRLDSFGEPTGETVMLHDIVIAEVQKLCMARMTPGESMTFLEIAVNAIIRKIVTEAVTAEVEKHKGAIQANIERMVQAVDFSKGD